MALARLREACEAYEEGDYDGDDEDSYLPALEEIRDAAFALVHESDTPPSTAFQLTPHEQMVFTYDNVDYRTAFNAFQAQKAPPDKRSDFSYLHIQEATDLGRKYPIDVAKWDSGRKDLMYKILKTQANQHSDFKQRILEHGDADDVGSGGMGINAFWESALPEIWKRLHAHFGEPPSKKMKKGSASGP